MRSRSVHPSTSSTAITGRAGGMSGVNFSFHEANVNLSGEPGPGWVIVNLTGNFQAGTAAIIGVVAAVHGIEALAMTTCAPASTR